MKECLHQTLRDLQRQYRLVPQGQSMTPIIRKKKHKNSFKTKQTMNFWWAINRAISWNDLTWGIQINIGYKPVGIPRHNLSSFLLMIHSDSPQNLRTAGKLLDDLRCVLSGTLSLVTNTHEFVAALYFVGGVRVTFSTGIAAGGNLAYWTSYVITCVFTFITAAVIAEICSSLPSAGSIYLWAAEAGGPKYGRLLGFIVAWVSSS